MKTSIKVITATIALSALMIGPASAMVPRSDITQDALSAAKAHTDLFVTVNKNDSVATVTGYFKGAVEKNYAIQAMKSKFGVDRVIDLTAISN